MSKKASEPTKPSSTYKIGDNTVATSYWDGNNYVSQYNPTSSESEVMKQLQAAIPTAYQDALSGGNAAQYAQNWYDSKLNELNETINPQMTALKDSLITGGQVGSNTAWNKIDAFVKGYNDSISELNTNKDTLAMDYRNNLLNYANSLQNSMNGYYNLGNQMSGIASSNQQNAANQNLQYTQYANTIENPYANLWSLVGTTGGAGLGALTGNPELAQLGASFGRTIADSLARKSG